MQRVGVQRGERRLRALVGMAQQLRDQRRLEGVAGADGVDDRDRGGVAVACRPVAVQPVAASPPSVTTTRATPLADQVGGEALGGARRDGAARGPRR